MVCGVRGVRAWFAWAECVARAFPERAAWCVVRGAAERIGGCSYMCSNLSCLSVPPCRRVPVLLLASSGIPLHRGKSPPNPRIRYDIYLFVIVLCMCCYFIFISFFSSRPAQKPSLEAFHYPLIPFRSMYLYFSYFGMCM